MATPEKLLADAREVDGKQPCARSRRDQSGSMDDPSHATTPPFQQAQAAPPPESLAEHASPPQSFLFAAAEVLAPPISAGEPASAQLSALGYAKLETVTPVAEASANSMCGTACEASPARSAGRGADGPEDAEPPPPPSGAEQPSPLAAA